MMHGDGPGISMAMACGEVEYPPLAYVAGVDFDPYDADEHEAVMEATERDAMSRADRLAEEVSALRAELASIRGDLEEAVDDYDL